MSFRISPTNLIKIFFLLSFLETIHILRKHMKGGGRQWQFLLIKCTKTMLTYIGGEGSPKSIKKLFT